MSDLSPSEQRDVVRDLYRTLYEEKSFDAVSEFYASGAVRHGGLLGTIEGREGLQAYLQGALGGLSDIDVTELRWLAEGDTIAYDFDMTAIHSGELMEVPATGNNIELTNTVWFRLEDGQVVDEWPRTDLLGLLTGIGVVDLPF